MRGAIRLNDPAIKAAYGCDVSASGVRIVRASAGRAGLRYETVSGGVPAIREAAWTACSLGVRDSAARWLTTPLTSVSKARQVFPSLLDIELPFPLEQCLHAFPVIEKTEQGPVRALAVAGRQETIASRIDACKEAGVDPVILDHEGLALWDQAVEECPAEASTLRVVIYLDVAHTTFTFGRGENFLSAHGLRAGANTDSGGSLPPLVEKMRRVLAVHQAEPGIRALQCLWVGPGAEDRERVSTFEASLRDSVEITSLEVREPALFLARALAARALAQRRFPCDLRQGEFTHPLARERRLTRRTRTARVYAACGLALVAVNLAAAALLHQRDRRMQADLEERAQRLAPGARLQKGKEVRAAEKAQTDLAAIKAPFSRLFEPSLTQLAGDILLTAKSSDLLLESFSLRGGSLSMKGTAEDWDQCEALERLARKHGFAATLKREDAGMDERVHFSLQGETDS